MISERYLQDLLPILKAHGVKHVKMQGLELWFHVEQSNNLMDQEDQLNNASNLNKSSVDHLADVVRKQEEALPADLRADSLMDQDKILNWSSPDQKPFEEEPELPLTGEQPL